MKKRGLIDSQFRMAGETSGNLQLWQKAKGMQACLTQSEQEEESSAVCYTSKQLDLMVTHALS